MDFAYSPRTQELQTKLLKFMDDYIYPAEAKLEAELAANTAAGKRWTPLNTIEELKPKARAIGLWNLFLPPTAGGQGSARRPPGGPTRHRHRGAEVGARPGSAPGSGRLRERVER